MKSTKKHETIKYKDGAFKKADDLLAVESLLSLKVNGKDVLSLYCTPLMVRELVVGFMMTEGIAEGLCTERMSITYDNGGVQVEAHAEGEVNTEGGTVTSGCVGGLALLGYGGAVAVDEQREPVSFGVCGVESVFYCVQLGPCDDMRPANQCITWAELAAHREHPFASRSQGR